LASWKSPTTPIPSRCLLMRKCAPPHTKCGPSIVNSSADHPHTEGAIATFMRSLARPQPSPHGHRSITALLSYLESCTFAPPTSREFQVDSHYAHGVGRFCQRPRKEMYPRRESRRGIHGAWRLSHFKDLVMHIEVAGVYTFLAPPSCDILCWRGNPVAQGHLSIQNFVVSSWLTSESEY
jgi:hypothetical protein